MRALILAVILAALAALPALAQTGIVKNPAPDRQNGPGLGHEYFTGETVPGLSATWRAGKNTSFTAGFGPGELDKSRPTVSGSAGITIRF